MSQMPEGFVYMPDFISSAEEAALLGEISTMEFSEIRMRGVVAKRRTIHLGWLYGYESWRIEPGPPMPEFLLPLRARCAEAAGLEADALAEALISEYPPGAAIGWHRDAPMFGIVAAVSLLGSCRMRFRTGEGRDAAKAEIRLEPRSFYLLSGEARTKWQHHIPATKELRYSITFRTVKKSTGEGRPAPAR
jgi:DNA oxidative demethylase